MRGIAVGALIALVIIATLVAMSQIHPYSSKGIEIVAHNTAKLKPGQQLVVHNWDLKTRKYWTVKYNEDGSVSADCGVWCGKQRKVLCGPGCEIELDTGMVVNSFKVNENDDGTINVRWPDGYNRD